MSADVLRRAATKIRETADKATPGPWVAEPLAERQLVRPGEQTSKVNRREEVIAWSAYDGGISADDDLHHIALWSPDIAELVADILSLEANVVDSLPDGYVSITTRLARRILGEPS